MRKPIELWQFIATMIGLIMSAGIFIVSQSNKIVEQGARISELESNKKSTEMAFSKVNDRLDKIADKLTDILVELQNKKDRDK